MTRYVVKIGEHYLPNKAPIAGHPWEIPETEILTHACIPFERKTLGEAKDFAMTVIRKIQPMHKFQTHPEQNNTHFLDWVGPERKMMLQPSLKQVHRKSTPVQDPKLQNGTYFDSYAIIEVVWFDLYDKDHIAPEIYENWILETYQKLKLDASKFNPTYYPDDDKKSDRIKHPIIRHI